MDLVFGSSSSSYMDCYVFFSDEFLFFGRSGVRAPSAPPLAPPSSDSSSVEAPSDVRRNCIACPRRMSKRRLTVILFVHHVAVLIVILITVARSVWNGRRRGGGASHEIFSALPSLVLGSSGPVDSCSVVPGLPSGSVVMAPPASSISGGVSPPGVSGLGLLVRRLRCRVGCSSGLESRLPINARELLAVRRGLLHFQSSLLGKIVAMFCDNVTAMAYLRKEGGTGSPFLNSLAQGILRWSESLHIRLAPQFIPGSRNVLADALSRPHQLPSSEWSLNLEVFLSLRHRWPVQIDLFATSENRRCSIYFSPIRDPQSAGTDAFLQSWDGLQAYAFPPWSIIPRVLAKLRMSRGDRAHSSGSVLAAEALVSGPPPAVAGTSSSPSQPSRPTVPASVSSALPGSPQATASCLETLPRFTRVAGFSSAVASQASLARRPSSRTNYQLKWSVYRSWCRSHGHSVSRPTLSKVADFLCWLKSSQGLSVSSIKGYRSMLSAVFQFHLPALSSHPVLRDLLRSFRISSAWDLAMVLRFLTSSEFEPLFEASLRALSQKTLFLVALATAKRVSELQALSSVVTSVWSDTCLSYVPQFVAMSESLTRSIPRSFLVKSLSDFVVGLDDDLLLCPVCALRIYLDRTRSVASVRHLLFISPRRPSRAMSKNAVSFFLREVSHAAGASRPEVGSVRAHEIRGVSTSVAFHRNWSVSTVLESATWSSSSVFSSFYLRDIQHEYDGIRSLGPFVAAGSRII